MGTTLYSSSPAVYNSPKKFIVMKSFTSFLVALLLLLPLNANNTHSAQPPSNAPQHVEKSAEQELLSAFIKLGLSENTAYIILAQARLESGHFSSTVFQQNCNPFGMKEAKVRPTTALGTHRGHAMYENLEEAARDFVLWMQHTNIPFHIDQPVEYICYLQQCKYFEANAQKYAKNLLAILAKIRPIAA